MSYCLKTGGLLFDEARAEVYSCDLHIEGDCVIAVTNEPQLGISADNPAVTLIVEAHAQPFYRAGTPYGTLVVRQRDCRVTPSLQQHIERWYPGYRLAFQPPEQVPACEGA